MATILIVDDRPTNRQFLVKLLGYYHHHLLEAADGAEGLKMTQSARPDLVIADILMPTMDGYEFVRQLRAAPLISKTPVIFYTAHYLLHEAQSLAQSCGVAHILTKPCKPDEIIKTVNAALGLNNAPAPAPPPEEFNQEHLRLLTNKVSQKVEELRATNLRLEALIQFGQELALLHDPVQLLGNFCQAARHLIGAKSAAVGILGEDGQLLRPFFTSGVAAAATPPVEELIHRILTERQPLCLRDLADASPTAGIPPDEVGGRSFLGLPLIRRTQLYGVLYLTDKLGAEEFSARDTQLAVTLAAQAAMAYENLRRYADLQHHATKLEQEIAKRQRAEGELAGSLEQLRALAARLQLVREEERAHAAREIHDELGQALTCLKIDLAWLAHQLRQEQAPLLEKTRVMANLIDSAIQSVHKICANLRPGTLDNLGLVSALQWQAQEFQTRTATRCECHFQVEEVKLHRDCATAVFRIFQELLTNVARHASASRVIVELSAEAEELVLKVNDNGRGITASELADPKSLGLLGMRERALLFGGEVSIYGEEGHGTTATIRVPLH